MGREVDDRLKKRAKEIEESFGGTSASDAIKLGIRFALKEQASSGCENSIGSVLVTFLYDAEVVSALKMLSPVQRSYNPSTKAWTVDILALPELLDHLQPLEYSPSNHLVDVASACKDLQSLLWGVEPQTGDADTKQPVIDLVDTDGEVEESLSAGNELERSQKLEARLKKLITHIARQKSEGETASATKLDRSDCGEAKRQRLSESQMLWSARKSGDLDDDDIFGYGSFFGSSLFSSFAKSHLRQSSKTRDTTPVDCDCGNPWKRVGGKHVCRYFGTFHCGCGNRWTSAFTWKGEKQACRSCNKESLPVKKDQLDGRPSKSTTGGAHDSARCAMCRRLGYDCSL